MTTAPGRTLMIGLLGLTACLMLAACDRPQQQDSETTQVLRVHDVSALDVEHLDSKLNGLLHREDLPLKGQVELMDDRRLAVNGSEHLQTQIERILFELGNLEASGESMIDREVRLQFWVLSLSESEPRAPLPSSLESIGDSIVAEFPDLNLNVEDFGEFFQWSGSSGHFRSGTGTVFHIRRLEASEDGAQTQARVNLSPNIGGHSYEINRILRPGEPLILGRARVGSEPEPRYQILIARMDWLD